MNEQNNPQYKNSIQNSKNTWTIIISIVVTALIVGFGIYMWQMSNLKTLQNQISILQQNKVNFLSVEDNSADEKTTSFPAFFVREEDNYVLYTKMADKKEKTGLVISVPQREYYDENQQIKLIDMVDSFSAVISPNGDKVAYITKKSLEDLTFYLFVADINGSNQEELARPEGSYAHGGISNDIFWSQDSQSVMYGDLKGDIGEIFYSIYSIDIETKEKVKIIVDSNIWDPKDPSTYREVEVRPAGYFKD